jgi:hypothetical protein
MDTNEKKKAKNIPTVLSDTRIRRAKPKQKPYMLFDRGGLGLYVLVTPRGSKLWQLKYRFNGRERRASLGQYPVVSLSQERERALKARQLISRGVDPNEEKKARKAAKYTFEIAAKEWVTQNIPKWTAGHTKKVRTRAPNGLKT